MSWLTYGRFIHRKEYDDRIEISVGQVASAGDLNNLIIGIRDGVMKVLKLQKENIWVYLEDLEPNQMIEYGEILPRSGEEKIWFDKLSPKLKKKLNDLER